MSKKFTHISFNIINLGFNLPILIIFIIFILLRNFKRNLLFFVSNFKFIVLIIYIFILITIFIIFIIFILVIIIIFVIIIILIIIIIIVYILIYKNIILIIVCITYGTTGTSAS